jgi:hypothetical protein
VVIGDSVLPAPFDHRQGKLAGLGSSFLRYGRSPTLHPHHPWDRASSMLTRTTVKPNGRLLNSLPRRTGAFPDSDRGRAALILDGMTGSGSQSRSRISCVESTSRAQCTRNRMAAHKTSVRFIGLPWTNQCCSLARCQVSQHNTLHQAGWHEMGYFPAACHPMCHLAFFPVIVCCRRESMPS